MSRPGQVWAQMLPLVTVMYGSTARVNSWKSGSVSSPQD
jgi:hypothetical protein